LRWKAHGILSLISGMPRQQFKTAKLSRFPKS
jgi:hypothetical protein